MIFFSCFNVLISMTGLLWAKPQQEKALWTLITTGMKGLPSHSRSSCVWGTVSCTISLVFILFLVNFGIVALEERLHRLSVWAEKSQSPASPAPPAQPIPNSDMLPIIQLPLAAQVSTASVTPPALTDAQPIPDDTVSPTTQLLPQLPSVPSPPTLTNAQPIPNVSESPIVQPPVQVPSCASNPNQSSFLFPQNSGFSQNLTQSIFPTSNLDFNSNPQQSLMDLMADSLYSWPDRAQQELGDQDLFNFSGLQSSSGMNNFINVRLVLQAFRVYRLLS